MAFPQIFLDDLQRGKSFFSELDAEDTENLESGCASCTVKNYECLSVILNSLEMKVELDEYDDVAITEYEKMLLIIGDYTVKIPPTVFAGVNQTLPIDETALFNAIITLGSGTLVSILWTQISGTPATLTNANTANLSVTNFPIGNITLKVTVTDSNDLTAVDTVVLTGVAVVPTVRVYYISKSDDIIPTEAEILAASFVDVVVGSNYVVPVNGDFNYHFVAQPSTEPNKVRWEDTVDTDNNGVIAAGNTWYDAGVVTTFEVYVTSFKTEFDNPLRFIQ